MSDPRVRIPYSPQYNLNEMIYIENITRPSNLEAGSSITFKLSDGSIYNGIVVSAGYYHICLCAVLNSKIFNLLGISNKHSFVSNIVGYPVSGDWPSVKTLEDLDKVLNALLEVNKPIKYMKDELQIEVEKQPSSEWDWLL